MLHVWNIYQHLPQKSPSFVGKYTSTMEHMGYPKQLILVGGFNPPEKFISQLGWLFPIYGKIIQMFQTTNQYSSHIRQRHQVTEVRLIQQLALEAHALWPRDCDRTVGLEFWWFDKATHMKKIWRQNMNYTCIYIYICTIEKWNPTDRLGINCSIFLRLTIIIVTIKNNNR